MNIRKFFKKKLESTTFMFIVFIVLSVVFVFFLSIITWAGMNNGMTCGKIRWVSPFIPCPYGEIHYNVSSPFIEVFIVFLVIYFGTIFIIFVMMVLINYFERREIDKI